MTLRALFDWWVERLLEWVPPSMLGRIGSTQDCIVLEWQAQGLRVAARQGGRLREFAVLAPEDLGPRRAGVNRFIADLSRRPHQVDVRIPPGRFLQREVELPLAAADSLHESVGFQLERIAPFRPEDAVYQCGLLRRDPGAKRLHAWVRVAPRALLAQAESLLEGIRLQPLPGPRTVPGEDSAMVLSFATGRRAALRGWAVPGLAIGLAGAAMSLHLSHRQAQLSLLEDALFEQRRAGAAAVELADELQRIQSEAEALLARRTAQPLLVAVLDDLSSRLDDQTWLQRFEFRGGEVRLYGVSAAASPLIARLEASPVLDAVRFEAAVNRDAASGGDRFSIAARVTGVVDLGDTP